MDLPGFFGIKNMQEELITLRNMVNERTEIIHRLTSECSKLCTEIERLKKLIPPEIGRSECGVEQETWSVFALQVVEERDALRAEVERLTKEREGWKEEARRYCENADYWRAEAVKLREDAERYRLVRNQEKPKIGVPFLTVIKGAFDFEGRNLFGDTADSVIDAARKGS